MLEDVLAIARPPVHAPDELDDLGVQAMYAGLVGRLLADVDDLGLDLLAGFVDDFLDSARMDAPVGDKLLEGEASNLPPDRIEARDDHRVRRVVDDDVDPGRQLEGPDVS